MNDYEKPGAFYLGRVVDPATSQVRPELLLYDSAQPRSTASRASGSTPPPPANVIGG